MGRIPSGMSTALYSNTVMKLFCMFVEDVGRGMKECLITSMFYLILVCKKKKKHLAVCSGSAVILFSSSFCQRGSDETSAHLWTEQIITYLYSDTAVC